MPSKPEHVAGPLLRGAPTSLIADLLHPEPIERVPHAQTRTAVALAFASGVAGGLFADALVRASTGHSTWEPAAFASELFLSTLVASGFEPRLSGNPATIAPHHVAQVLAHPPSDPRVVHYRRAITSELLDDARLRAELLELYGALLRFRAGLEGATGGRGWDSNLRQIELLTLFKEIVDRSAAGFVSARSGLARVAAFGRRIQASEPYQSLAALLDHDAELATVRLEVGIGSDGRIRRFSVLSVDEKEDNAFARSPLRRWLGKAELFVRGYRFGDGEVMARLLDAVFEGVADDVARLVQLAGEIELYLGAMAFADRAREAGLPICMPALVAPGDRRELLGLYNPLLVVHGVRPVPCDVDIDRHDACVLVTGPNSGGKTRLLQAVALAQVLAQAGLFVPAREAKIALAPALVVSFIEETKPDQAEGRLGMELMRIRKLFEKLPAGAVVVLDELCSGTNPEEGEEIFELVVRALARLAPQAFITTHFLRFAARLEREGSIPELRFLQVQLGDDHRPTFQFAPGVAKTSMARHTAARLGVTGEELLRLIERRIGPAGDLPESDVDAAAE